MAATRLLPTAALVLLACLLHGCGDRTRAADAEPRTEGVAREPRTDPETSQDADEEGEDDGPGLYLHGVTEAELDGLLAGLGSEDIHLVAVLGGSAAPVPDPGTHFPIEGPMRGALFSLGAGRGFYEFSHNEHWGISALYLYDAAMRCRDFDETPVLNVLGEEASLALEPSRESFEEIEDGGWHFEDDALLGYPEGGRFRFRVDGRTYTPVFAHIHVGHGHAHAPEHASGPHIHGLGPHRGYVLTLGTHRAHVEVVHKPHWGILGVYVYDAAMEPREIDEAPVLNMICDGEPIQLTAGTENWDGEEDGGWHFEDDALLGETGPARFRLVVDGKTWTPRFTYYTHGEEPGHSHDQGGH